MFPKISHVINDGPMMTQWWPDLGGDRRFPMWCSWSMLAMWTTTQQGSSQHHWWYWKITRWKIWSWVDYPFLGNSTWLENPTHHTKKADKKKATLRHVCLSRVVGQYVWERPHFCLGHHHHLTTIQLRALRLGMRVPAVRQLRWHWEPGGLKRTVGTYT